MLNAEELKSILDYDCETGIFTWKIKPRAALHIGDIAGSVSKDGYIKIIYKKKLYIAHRLAWLYVYGEYPKKEIDHINRIKNDNRLCNLRDVEPHINCQNKNKRIDNTSGYTGVYWSKENKKWKVQYTFNKVKKHLGTFDNLEIAVKVYQAEKLKYEAC